MQWGVGTGRCGTKSLAADLGGLHEPQPWLGPDAIEAYYGDREALERCTGKLAGRLALGAPAVVDLKQSYLIPLICEIDPAAAFIWMVREPLALVRSMLAGGWWTEKNRYGAWLWRPPEGWPEAATRFDKIVTYWCEVGRLIERDLAACGAPWQRRLTSELSHHENKYPSSPGWQLTDAETARVAAVCGPLWEAWRHG